MHPYSGSSLHRVVVDASIVIDLFAGRSRERVVAAERVFTCIEARRGSVRLFAPRLFLAELSGVLVRFLLPPEVRRITDLLEAEVATIGDDLYFRESVGAALKTGSRGADSYYIGLARVLSAVLATSDRVQAVNARRAGVEAYYVPEEVDVLLRRLGCGQPARR